MTDTLETPRDVITRMGQRARAAARALAAAPTHAKNRALECIAENLMAEREAILAANRLDLERAQAEGLSAAFIDRLTITEGVLSRMAEGVREIIALPDPIGGIEALAERPSGIRVGRMRAPLGVIGMIFESRPNVAVDASALTIKSGNALILRGGHEALESVKALAAVVAKSLQAAGLPADGVQVIASSDRSLVGELIRADKYVDVLIPRGGKGLVSRLMREATVPMIKHLDGICHTYVDAEAALEMALKVVDNAKTQRYSPCNTTETLLVHERVAKDFLPMIGRVFEEKHVEMRADPTALAVLTGSGLSALPAAPEDWDTEYNAPIISIAVVPSLTAAIDFIEAHGSHHTDAIITNNYANAERFLREVDSASVMVNASTRFADGFEYGLGAEIGISTNKLHVRGPVGLEGLTNQKWVVLGHGEGRQ